MSRRQLAQGVDHLGAIGWRDEIQVAGADELLPCFAEEAAVGMVYFKQPAIHGAKACRLGVVLQQSLALFIFP